MRGVSCCTILGADRLVAAPLTGYSYEREHDVRRKGCVLKWSTQHVG
jgi:hypothetical protein